MATVDDEKTHVFQLWAIQSNLLIMFRSIFLMALSVILAATVILFNSEENWFTFSVFVLVSLLGFTITLVWTYVDLNRGRDVN